MCFTSLVSHHLGVPGTSIGGDFARSSKEELFKNASEDGLWRGRQFFKPASSSKHASGNRGPIFGDARDDARDDSPRFGDERDDSPEHELLFEESPLAEDDDVDNGIKERPQHESPVFSVSACAVAFSSICCLRRAYSEVDDLGDLGEPDAGLDFVAVFEGNTSCRTAAPNCLSCTCCSFFEAGGGFNSERHLFSPVMTVRAFPSSQPSLLRPADFSMESQGAAQPRYDWPARSCRER